MATVRARDGCVVETAGLAAMLKTFIGSRAPARGGQFSARLGDDLERVGDQISPLAWLAAETLIPEETLGNILRDPPRYRTTELWIADRLVTALDRPEAFHDGTLTVRGNSLARLRLQSSGSSRSSYRARIEFAGQLVGQVRRSKGMPYRAYVGGELVAAATTLGGLRRELHQRVPNACCGGSLVGVADPL